MLELIIEKGMHLLQTGEGEKLPRVVETVVRQKAAEPGLCQFTIFVNEPGLCRYDDIKKQFSTPRGKHLRDVKVLKTRPRQNELIPEMLLCECQVAMYYETSHRHHFQAAPVAN